MQMSENPISVRFPCPHPSHPSFLDCAAKAPANRLVHPQPAPGDLSVVAPPVPIPNTAVKHPSANGSRTQGSARVGRCQIIKAARKGGFFYALFRRPADGAPGLPPFGGCDLRLAPRSRRTPAPPATSASRHKHLAARRKARLPPDPRRGAPCHVTVRPHRPPPESGR